MLIYLRIGDEKPIARMYIHMTTINMLDATNQCNMDIYHIDGTYHITINNFPLFDFFSCFIMIEHTVSKNQ